MVGVDLLDVVVFPGNNTITFGAEDESAVGELSDVFYSVLEGGVGESC